MAHGWTIKTLKAHFDALRKDDQTAIASALASAEKAVVKAESATNDRLAGLNELRGAMADQASLLAPRGEVDAKLAAQTEMIGTLKDRMTAMEGVRKGVGISANTVVLSIAAVASVIGILIGVSTLFAGPRALPVSSPVVYGGPSPSGMNLPATVKP